MKRWLSLLFFTVMCLVRVVEAADWKALHDEARGSTIVELRADVAAEPGSIEALYRLALGYLTLNDVDGARRTFREILEREPEHVGGRWGLAELQRREYELDAAEEALMAVIEDDPTFAPAYITLGYLLFDKDEYERSIRLGRKVIRLGKDKVDLTNFTRAYLIIGGARGMLSDRGGPFAKIVHGAQVLPYMKKAQRVQPENPGVYFGLGSFYAMAPRFAGGDKEKGLVLLKKAVEADPKFADAWARLAQMLLEAGDEEGYARCLAKAQALDPRNKLVLKVEKLKK